jgi:putative membrane protein
MKAPMRDEAIEAAELRGEAIAVRAVIGGALMGLANLVPGISGGTMLLAVGIYPQFISGVAEVSTFRLRPRSLVTLGCVVGAAAAAIVSLAGVVSSLVIDHRWIMYSLFIGLTLGGVPVIWRMVRPLDATVVAMSVAGIAGGSAMILPGVSGGYLLLVLGQYLIILTAIDEARAAVGAGDWQAASQALHVFVPVGLGVVIGVVGVSNIMKLLLDRYERATLGFLLGLLLGAVIGLWPFQEGVAPAPGDTLQNDRVALVDDRLVLESSGLAVEAEDYPTRLFRPTWPVVAASAGLIALGFAASTLVARLGNGKR